MPMRFEHRRADHSEIQHVASNGESLKPNAGMNALDNYLSVGTCDLPDSSAVSSWRMC